MQHEEIINCPKSGGDLCYKVQVAPEIYNYMSLSCGFWTNSFMKEDHEFYMQQIETLPELYKDLAWVDPETGLIWLPNLINQEGLGMVFAYGTDKNTWGWAAVKAIEIPENERENHPIPGKPGKFMSHKMDMENMKIFKENDYIEALSHVGLLPE
jgi:hypothetical protein